MSSLQQHLTDSHDAKMAVIIKTLVSAKSQTLIPSSPSAKRISGCPIQLRP